MTFFNPWAFGFVGLVPVIIALYLLKVRRRPVPVSTLLFWQRVMQENQRRALFQRLRQWLSLLLHLLILALLMLALSRPSFDRAIHEGSSTVLILDTRARMLATEADGMTRMQKARLAANAMARQAAPGRQMAVATTERNAGIRLGFTGDDKGLREKIDACSAIDGGGDLQGAIELASDLLASRAGEKRIVIFTDRVEPVPERKGIKISREIIGTARENVAITRFASRATQASPNTFETLLEVANFRPLPWKGSVEISLDGALLDVRPFVLAPGERTTQIFPIVIKPAVRGATPAGHLVAHLSAGDSLPVDDSAYVLLPLAPPPRVLLVTKGNWFLEKLLSADTSVRFELLAPDAYQPSMASQFDVVIMDDVPGEKSLPAEGRFLFIKQSPFTAGDDLIEQPLITDIDAEHPALRLTKLEHVTLSKAVSMQLPKDASGWQFETPLRFGEHPLLITGQRGFQRVAALGFSVTDSDFPLRVAFPLMIDQLLHWLAGKSPEASPAYRSGELLDGISLLTKNGFQDAADERGKPRAVAVNTFDEIESDLRASGDAGAKRSDGFSKLMPSRFAASGLPPWRYLALAALILFAGEWWLFHRRQTE